jgi:anti-anti-sigma factor
VQLAWSHDQAVLALAGELDLATVHHVHDAVREITLRPGRVVHVDLSKLTFADVAGVRALYYAVHELRQAARQVSVTGMQFRVRRVADCLGTELTACSPCSNRNTRTDRSYESMADRPSPSGCARVWTHPDGGV